MTVPNNNMNPTLIAILRETTQLLSRKENDFSWSSWDNEKAATAEIQEHIERILYGNYSRIFDLKKLYAPTGPIQETSISSGWSKEYLELAARFDKEISKLRKT